MKMVKFTFALCILLVTCGVQGSESSEDLSDRDWIIWRVAKFFEEIEEKQIEMSMGRCSVVNATATFIQEVGTILEGVKEWEEKIANIPADPAVLSSCLFEFNQNLTFIWEDYAAENIECVILFLTGYPESYYRRAQEQIKEFENNLNNVMAQLEECTDSSCLQGIRELLEDDITYTYSDVLISIEMNIEQYTDFEYRLEVCNDIYEVTQNAGNYYYEDIKLCVDESSANTAT